MTDVIPLADAQKKLRAKSRKATRDGPQPTWLSACITDERGRVLPVLANVLIALRSAPELSDVFAFDEMQRAAVQLRELPLAPGGQRIAGTLPRPVRDVDIGQIQEWLQHAGLPKIGREHVHQAVDQRAGERAFHAVRDYLDGLKWDGKPRLHAWLATYLGAAGNTYTEGIGRLFLIAMVARVYRPGCKADYVMVLEGEQGAGKSRACRTLAGDWFSDHLPDIRDKDAAQHLRGKWLVEIAELSAIGKADAEALKSFISRPEEKYRPAYGRNEVIEPRQCVFAGSTNRAVYLKDETGARRFWPVKVGRIDIDAIARDRDMLFAEAVEAFRSGEKWWPDAAFERQHIAPEQRQRFDVDPWDPTIRAFLLGRNRTTINEIATQALALETKHIGTSEQRRISSVITEMGWASARTAKERFYVRPVGGNDA